MNLATTRRIAKSVCAVYYAPCFRTYDQTIVVSKWKPSLAQMFIYQRECSTLWWFWSAATSSRHSAWWQWLPFVNFNPLVLLVTNLGWIWDLFLELITLILLLVMLTCAFFGSRRKTEILITPVATLFAFTQLRGSGPGAPPGFGNCFMSLALSTPND